MAATHLGRTRLEDTDKDFDRDGNIDEFVALIIGFMQDLDRRLSRQPSRFESSVLRALRDREQIEDFTAGDEDS